MDSTKKIIFGIFISIITIGILYGVWSVMGKPAEIKKVEIDTSSDPWILGNRSSNNVMVEYSDFQCPACQVYAPLVKAAVKKYEQDIKFVFRHFPLAQHKNARKAAYAAEAAGMQNNFFQMHDILFETQQDWSNLKNVDKYFQNQAKKLKLDIKKFMQDYQSDAIKNNVQKNYEQGIQNGIEATPTFFLNGIKLANIRSQKDFENAIENVLVDD